MSWREIAQKHIKAAGLIVDEGIVYLLSDKKERSPKPHYDWKLLTKVSKAIFRLGGWRAVAKNDTKKKKIASLLTPGLLINDGVITYGPRIITKAEYYEDYNDDYGPGEEGYIPPILETDYFIEEERIIDPLTWKEPILAYWDDIAPREFQKKGVTECNIAADVFLRADAEPYSKDGKVWLAVESGSWGNPRITKTFLYLFGFSRGQLKEIRRMERAGEFIK